MMKMGTDQSHRGFTLVELLVAIAIFSVLSLTGWVVFDQTMKIRERNVVHEQRVQGLQMMYAQFNRDILQIAALESVQQGDAEPAFMLEQHVLQFSKVGVLDPLQQGLPSDERIEYRFDANRQVLERSRRLNLRANQPQPETAIILDQVSELTFTVLNPESQEKWPIQQNAEQDLAELPKGVRLSFVLNEQSYEMVWALPIRPTVEASRQSTTNNGTDTDQQGEN